MLRNTLSTYNLQKLILLNPLETMKRGFAIPYTKTGEIIKTFKRMKIGFVNYIHELLNVIYGVRNDVQQFVNAVH